MRRLAGAVVAIAALASCTDQDGTAAMQQGSADRQVAQAPYPEQVYWGDTHLHTANSLDAFAFGNRLGPEQALRFARGEKVTSTTGIAAQLSRPLDFLVVADHSDSLGVTRRLYEMPPSQVTDPVLRHWQDLMKAGPRESQKIIGEMMVLGAKGGLPKAYEELSSEETTHSIWTEHTGIVERYNEPSKFTAFMGFEYSLQPNGNNLHRVVIFRDGKDRADQVLPFSSRQGNADPEKLWDYMDRYEQTTGGRVLAIPHNSNVSNGLMFELVGPDGGPMTADYARRRVAHEPLVEATQIKGDSEAHPFLSPNDEFAGYGVAGWDQGNLPFTIAKQPGMLAGEYVREALKRGLAVEARTGVNPYKLGMIGSTDSHTSLATADDDNFFGKHTGNEPNAIRAMETMDLGGKGRRIGWNFLASGYAAVWATANTREALFDAMMRREVYATTGPRMKVRLFGGWDFSAADLKSDWVKSGYARGVPMGGDLRKGARGAPSFIVSAVKDPIGANLDRVQIVKGWVDATGKTHEKVFDVVWSDMTRRQRGANGKVPAVGNTVKEATASYSNSIGAAELTTVWRDPEFDANQSAFYYVRVLEIPTPRWVLYDALRYGAKLGPDIEKVHQERAYTSPIWYRPAG
ncbi:MAG: DUF3604 domain-containing protein [Novosphingobium sp.]|nr:DUF3604 domain-containing protein [Novosphingobium sp.]